MLLHDTILDRAKRKLRGEFPFTGGHVQRMARRRGYLVGEHRALRMTKLLIDAGEIVPCGSYRQEKAHQAGEGSFRVRLFQLPGTSLRKGAASVRRRRRVKRKRVPWWRDPLMGFGTKAYPKSLPPRLSRWKPPPEEYA
jgi:hypothetical protein